MPHRFHALSYVLTTATEGVTLALISVMASLNAILDEQSWERLTGRHGALFVLAIGCFVFWNAGRLREKREAARELVLEEREVQRRRDEENARAVENAAREQRHREAIELQRQNSDRLTELTAEGIKAQLKTASALGELAAELKRRPCQK